MANGAPGPLPASWIDQAARIVTTVGFPVVVAALLLWWVLFRFEAHIDVITARMEQNGEGVNALVSAMREQTDELREQTDALRAFVNRAEQKGGH